MLATATTDSAFLVGIVAKANGTNRDSWYWVGVCLATASYLIVLAWTIQILRPKNEWNFNLSPKVITERYTDHPTPATLAEAHRRLAFILLKNIESNEKNLNPNAPDAQQGPGDDHSHVSVMGMSDRKGGVEQDKLSGKDASRESAQNPRSR